MPQSATGVTAREIDEAVDTFMAAWPSGMDLAAFAEKLVQAVGYREQNVVRISSRLAGGTEEQRSAAALIDDLLLTQFLDGLPRAVESTQCNWAYIKNRDELLRYLGQTINRKRAPTNFVLHRMNPIIEEYIQVAEFQRASHSETYTKLQIATCLISLGLEVAATANAPENFREGMAVDYIHWIGRLMRSEIARTRFDHSEAFDEFWRDDVAYCASQNSYRASRPRVQG